MNFLAVQEPPSQSQQLCESNTSDIHFWVSPERLTEQSSWVSLILGRLGIFLGNLREPPVLPWRHECCGAWIIPAHVQQGKSRQPGRWTKHRRSGPGHAWGAATIQGATQVTTGDKFPLVARCRNFILTLLLKKIGFAILF